MTYPNLAAALEHARAAAAAHPEHREAVLTAVLTVELLKQTTTAIPTAPPSPIVTKALSIQEVHRDLKPTSDVERTLVFGYYLEIYKNIESFTAKDIVACYREAKEPVPPNVHDKILMNIKKGWLMTKGTKREGMQEYTLTNTGLTAIQEKFGRK